MKRAGSWTTADDIARDLERKWAKGAMLASRVEGVSAFPLRLSTAAPTAEEAFARFEAVRHWIRALEAGSRAARGFGYDIEWRAIRHPRFGTNDLPTHVVIPTEDDALRLIDKCREGMQFQTILDDTLSHFPELRPWLARRALTALEHADDWGRILAVLRRFRDHPRPGHYLRQLDIAGIDTKFIEARKGLLTELLDVVLPASAVDVHASTFEGRYGLRPKPLLVRFRTLDPAWTIGGYSDLTVPAEEFARIELPVERVFIMENEVNGLAFPGVPGGMVIFGLGYGVDRLATALWLARREIHYWGDIDTHGFAILDRLRQFLPAARSLLMDRETLTTHQALWVTEDAPFTGELHRLNPAERALFDELRSGRVGARVRLEQERLGFAWVADRIERAWRPSAY